MDIIQKLFNKHGNDDYIGENVSQLQHMTQMAKLAENAGSNQQVIVACFLHDIGHLIQNSKTKNMIDENGINHGVYEHEIKGSLFCEQLGLPELVCDLIKNHISAKRYLCTVDREYFNKLSDASKQTFKFQGSHMTDSEIIQYKLQPRYQLYLKMRLWDDQAKNPNFQVELEDLDRYYKMIDVLIKLYSLL